jgi:hypothetical protein
LGRIICRFADRLEQNMDSMPVPQIPQAMIGELKALLEGQATSRIEHTVKAAEVSNFHEYERLIASFEKKARGPDRARGPENPFSRRKTRRPSAGPAGGPHQTRKWP